MIERYNLNLGRGMTIPVAVRRKYYVWMVGYLLFAGLVFVEGTFQVVRRLKEVSEASSSRLELHERFSFRYSGSTDPQSRMEELMALNSTQMLTAKSLGNQIKPSVPFLPVLFEMQRTLPSDITLSLFKMTAGTLSITLHFPMEGKTNPEMYLAWWRENAILNSYLESLTVDNRKDGSGTGDKRMIELSCSAALKNR